MLRRIKTAQIFLLLLITMFFTVDTSAHCDSKNGPVAVDAREALKTGNFDLIAIWVGEEQSYELRAKFNKALEVYNMNNEAKSLAEKYFVETAVRLHREAEGMPYTGLKPAGALPVDIAQAEEALKTGDVNVVTDLLKEKLSGQTQKWFDKALTAKNNYTGENIKAGREWVDAYVKYIIYVHGLYQTIQAGPAHGVGE